jgi:L-ascorbate metabolism protein UlaG (beta-lactamase superfamily)
VTERLTWLGHATVVIELAGAVLLTDPVLRSRVAHLRRHAPAPRAPPRVDAVLVSHLHRDHLDLPSLRRVDPSAPVVVPAGGARALRRTRRDVHELAAGQALDLAGVRVHAVRAVHDGHRSPLGRAADAVGYVVEAHRRVYFAGDTERFDGMADLAGVDAALLPIWGWGTKLGAGHMDPEQAARATALLRPHVVIPIHWGTFLPLGHHRRHGHLLHEPARAFAGRVAELAPEVRVETLAPGESLERLTAGRRTPRPPDRTGSRSGT